MGQLLRVEEVSNYKYRNCYIITLLFIILSLVCRVSCEFVDLDSSVNENHLSIFEAETEPVISSQSTSELDNENESNGAKSTQVSRCNRNKQSCRADLSNVQVVCGSNGQFYSSICEMNLDACLSNATIQPKNHKYCQRRFRRRPSKIKLVEMSKKCDQINYQQMKSMLLSEFDFDLKRMFEYLDSNRDGKIEAHELWPKSNDANPTSTQQTRLIWYDSNVSNCGPQFETSSHAFRKICYVDFAFEPNYPDTQNPCSLSHLMLYELRPPNSRFNLESFRRIFEPKEDKTSDTESKKQLAKSQRIGKLITLRLGDSIRLDCGKNSTPSIELDETPYTISSCWWKRFDVDLATIQDPHLIIEHDSRSLVISDGQLYLSGEYRCNCKRQDDDQSEQATEQAIYLIQVLGEYSDSRFPYISMS